MVLYLASYVTQWKIKNNDKELAIIKLAPFLTYICKALS